MQGGGGGRAPARVTFLAVFMQRRLLPGPEGAGGIGYLMEPLLPAGVEPGVGPGVGRALS